MKGLFVLSLLLSLVIADNGKWQEYVSYEGKFRVLAPGKMQNKKTTVDTPIGAIIYHTSFCQLEGKDVDNYVYMVSYCDYPEGSIHSDSLRLLSEFFETTINTAAESVNGQVIYSTEISKDGFPGRLWRVDYKEDTGSIKSKAFLAGRRFYSIQTVTLREKSLNPSIDRFLDSFSLIE